jgi:predicted PurR-regulated permease PerM
VPDHSAPAHRPSLHDRPLARNFFVAILLGSTFLFFYVVADFLIPVLLAGVFCTLFYPLYDRLRRALRGRRSAAASLCCLLLLLGLIVPIYVVADLVVRQGVELYSSADKQIRHMLEPGYAGSLAALQHSQWVRSLRLDQMDWRSTLQEAAKTAGSFVAMVINKTSRGTLQVLLVLFVTLFTMFYFFRDGEALVARLKYLVPLAPEYQEDIIDRFVSVSRATVRGTVVICILQGSLAGLTLFLFGVGSAVLWGVATGLLTILPVGGAWLVLYPAGLIQILTGHLWRGIGILVVTTIVVVNIDNFVRPRVVGHAARMHDLMVFFSTLGGVATFGAMGFIVGPVIAALFLSVVDIYSAEFKDDLVSLAPDLETRPAASPPPLAEPAISAPEKS